MRCRSLLLFILLLCSADSAFAQVFTSITPPDCPADSAGLFTTGQQFVDADNGVLPNSWSMLVRWQGNPTVGPTQWITHPMEYNGGIYTGYTPPGSYVASQRGFTPENPGGTPGVQLHCFDAGMLINTWATPHDGAPVVGGQFNDMYGYAWAPSALPYAFRTVRDGAVVPAELVIQADLGVPLLVGWSGAQQSDGSYAFTPVADTKAISTYGSATLAFFVYLADTAHPLLHPIVILAAPFDNGYSDCASWVQGPNAFMSYDYGVNAQELGVWFASDWLCNSDVTTVRYTSPTQGFPYQGQGFFRVHVTPQNLVNFIHRINAQQCQAGTNDSCGGCVPGQTCPSIGYSTNPNDYKIRYVGIIAEVALCDTNGTNVHCSTNLRDATQPGYNPGQDSNLSFGLNANGVAAYHYTAD